MKCIVQLELIQSIDNIIFYPATSKRFTEKQPSSFRRLTYCSREDAETLLRAQELGRPTSRGSKGGKEDGREGAMKKDEDGKREMERGMGERERWRGKRTGGGRGGKEDGR